MSDVATAAQMLADEIRDAFRPTITVINSASVESVCRKNGMTLAQRLTPYSRMQTDCECKTANCCDYLQ